MKKLFAIFSFLITVVMSYIVLTYYPSKNPSLDFNDARQVSIPEGESIIVKDPAEIAKLAKENGINIPSDVVIEKIELEHHANN